MVATKSAGQALKKAIQKIGKDRFYVKLCTVINPEDALAIDIRYHKRCGATNATNIDHKGKNPQKMNKSMIDKLGAQLEFPSLVEATLLDGKVPSITGLQEVYNSIPPANGKKNPNCNHKKMKQLLQAEIQGLKLHKPKHMNETELVTLKGTRYAAVQLMEESTDCSEVDMRTLFSVASILRKAISKANRWT